jgi:hypothetical protein
MKRILLGTVAALVCACGGSDSSTVAPPGNASGLDVSGTWSATWTSRSGQIGQGTLQFTQSVASVAGTAVIDDSPCFANVDVSATIAGDELTGTMTAGGASATFDTTVDGSRMSGTYDVVSGGTCTGDTGTIIATR